LVYLSLTKIIDSIKEKNGCLLSLKRFIQGFVFRQIATRMPIPTRKAIFKIQLLITIASINPHKKPNAKKIRTNL
jgi:hypothetical protein